MSNELDSKWGFTILKERLVKSEVSFEKGLELQVCNGKRVNITY